MILVGMHCFSAYFQGSSDLGEIREWAYSTYSYIYLNLAKFVRRLFDQQPSCRLRTFVSYFP